MNGFNMYSDGMIGGLKAVVYSPKTLMVDSANQFHLPK